MFAGGDVAKGPGSIIEAIAAGRHAGLSIDKYLGGDGSMEYVRQLSGCETSNPAAALYDGKRAPKFDELKRVDVPILPLAERLAGFAEVDLCYSDEAVLRETKQCFHCNLEICLAQSQVGRKNK